MATVFWDTKGILFIDYKEMDACIRKEYYATLIERSKDSIKERKRVKLAQGVLLLHDNAPVHQSLTPSCTRQISRNGHIVTLLQK